MPVSQRQGETVAKATQHERRWQAVHRFARISPRKARLTVAVDTPDLSATSLIVGDIVALASLFIIQMEGIRSAVRIMATYEITFIVG